MTRAEILIHLLPVVFLVAGCAAPQAQRVAVSDAATKVEAARQLEIAVREIVEEQKRITRIYRQLATGAHALCGEHVGPNIGAYLMRNPKGELGDTFARLYGIKDRQTLLFSLESGPAEKAGMMAGDVIMSVNGVATDDKATIEELTEKLPPEAPIVFGIERTGIPMTISVQPERACSYSVRLAPQQIVNAFADGKNIVIARGMMGFAKDDNELALVLSHEMAHNAMKHIDAKKQNAGLGVFADLAFLILTRGRASSPNFGQAGANAFSQELEAEADYVGLYIMAYAGKPIANAPHFWRRMAANNPANIKTNYSASHPSTSYRMVAVEQTVKEINEKLARNEPLRPNMKDGKAVAAAVNRPTAAAAYASIDNVDAVPGLTESGKNGYRAWLLKVKPRAFVICANGSWEATWGYLSDPSEPKDAAERALAHGNSHGKTNCKLYAVNDRVVWGD